MARIQRLSGPVRDFRREINKSHTDKVLTLAQIGNNLRRLALARREHRAAIIARRDGGRFRVQGAIDAKAEPSEAMRTSGRPPHPGGRGRGAVSSRLMTETLTTRVSRCTSRLSGERCAAPAARRIGDRHAVHRHRSGRPMDRRDAGRAGARARAGSAGRLHVRSRGGTELTASPGSRFLPKPYNRSSRSAACWRR